MKIRKITNNGKEIANVNSDEVCITECAVRIEPDDV